MGPPQKAAQKLSNPAGVGRGEAIVKLANAGSTERTAISPSHLPSDSCLGTPSLLKTQTKLPRGVAWRGAATQGQSTSLSPFPPLDLQVGLRLNSWCLPSQSHK